MKHLILPIFILLCTSCSGKSEAEIIEQAVKHSYSNQSNIVENSSDESFLAGIQQKIYDAFVQGIMSNNKDALDKINIDLDKLYEGKKNNLVLYWKAYLQYYLAIFYIQQNDKKNSENEIDRGVDLMKKMNNKNSEDYALLAMLQSFAIQFKGIGAMFVSKRIKKNGNLSIAIDSTNIRGYYVLGSNDFYTPKKYGGGKEVEKYLLKAISLSTQKMRNPYLPSWGKEEAYELLIKYYIKKENWEQAKKYFQEGIKLFPQNYQLTQLATKLIGK